MREGKGGERLGAIGKAGAAEMERAAVVLELMEAVARLDDETIRRIARCGDPERTYGERFARVVTAVYGVFHTPERVDTLIDRGDRMRGLRLVSRSE